MRTNDRLMSDLMKAVDKGDAQLPDFQRGWVWSDSRIRALIASITCNYPISAAMFLTYNPENIRFKYRPIEGANNADTSIPTELVLDGQQRLTSIYQAMYDTDPAKTRNDQGRNIERYYYIDIEKALSDEERVEAIISVPETKIVTSDFGRKVDLDVSTREKEFQNKLFPINIIFDNVATQKWQMEYLQYYGMDTETSNQYFAFSSEILLPTLQYRMPVILLDADTSKEAVCRVFENVNTGGVSLTVFELVTAMFAMDDFELRKDWEDRREGNYKGDILKILTATDFITACTLIASYYRNKATDGATAVSCKKKDVLALQLSDYKKYADPLTAGFKEAEKILEEERIFSHRDLPYTTQLIPLAVLCTILAEGNKIKTTAVKNKLKQWFWCIVFGEQYGSALETKYANDVQDVMAWISDDSKTPRSVAGAYFNPTRLLTLQSRQSAAYKGIMALILQNHAKDFISGREMDFTVYKSENIDIHHIFPKDYCEKNNYPKAKWNSVVNKTPITYSTNREIGGAAPSKYLSKIEEKGKVDPTTLDEYVKTHWIDIDALRNDKFDDHIISRAITILDNISDAMGKRVSGRDSEEVIAAFGRELR